jgi:redox-sensitive bicupin YhaK (pirin superfamily)
MTTRTLQRIIQSRPTSDGAGVKLRRSLGTGPGTRHDPFLMLDEFGTENPGDYIAGFPPHPHRGFETVTYMLEGHMRHEDHMGNVGELTAGGVQWMTAGRGVLHSEMPQQKEGRMRGFQLWINLPAKEKMKPASYRDIPASELPVVEAAGVRIKVIAGSYMAVTGPISSPATDPLFLDLELAPHGVYEHSLPPGHNALVYAYEGAVLIGGEGDGERLPAQAAGLMSPGERVRIEALGEGARAILLAARPLNEPIVQHGPFVMNTREEIEQAMRDYRNGTLTGQVTVDN